MPEAVLLREHGGPHVLKLEALDVPPPGPGQVRLRQTAIGVNFHDCYVRSGLCKTLALPGVPGIEAVGVVDAASPGVADYAAGDRVAYITSTYGAYASERVVDADLLVKLPAPVDDRLAAATLLKGLTAQMLVFAVKPIGPGDTVLVHAAAGGVGQLLCQGANALGAHVIGTVGSEAKAEIARASGCRDVILYRQEDVASRVAAITDGQGVDAAYDSVGKDTFEGSLASLAERGHLINFGQSSGPIPPFEIARLSKGSYSLTRPMLFHYAKAPDRLPAMAADLFQALADGTLRPPPPTVLPLANAAEAHRMLEARETTGAVLLETGR